MSFAFSEVQAHVNYMLRQGRLRRRRRRRRGQAVLGGVTDGPQRPRPNWTPLPWPVPQALAGSATVTPDGPVEAGSWQSFVLLYTAGRFGIDDSGSLKICFRFATDQTRLQVSDPRAPGFVSVEASNGAVLETRFDYKQNTRPWDRTLHIKVVRGYLREGDTIAVRLGDRRQGSPGLRVQTFSEPFFEFRTLVDPIACYHFVPVAEQPTIEISGGARDGVVAVLPSVAAIGESFCLRIRSEDRWGNPTDRGSAELWLRADLPVAGLPATVRLGDGQSTAAIDGLAAAQPGDLAIELGDRDGRILARSNPLRIRRTSRAPAVLGGLSCAERRDHRHQLGRRLFRLRPRYRLHRHGRPPGQRFPDHRGVLDRAQRAL